jgi:hypothetical protein
VPVFVIVIIFNERTVEAPASADREELEYDNREGVCKVVVVLAPEARELRDEFLRARRVLT